MRFLRKHCEGGTEGAPEYFYAAVDGFVGNVWPQLYLYRHEAERAAKNLEGRVVIVTVRPMEDAEGDDWPLPVCTPDIERAELKTAVDEAEAAFEDAMSAAVAKQQTAAG